MVGKERVYKLTAKQVKKASGLYKSGKGITTKTGLARGLRKAKMPASGQAIINFLKSRRGAQVAQPFHKEVQKLWSTKYHKKEGYYQKAMSEVKSLAKWKVPREARLSTKGLRKRIKGQKELVGTFYTKGRKVWCVYYEVGIGEGSPPDYDQDEIEWQERLEQIHAAPDKPSKAAFTNICHKVQARTENAHLQTRNYRLVHVVSTKTESKGSKRTKEASKKIREGFHPSSSIKKGK